MIALVGNSLLMLIFRSHEFVDRRKALVAMLFFCAVYLMYVVGLIGTDNLRQGLSGLETKMGIVLIPFALAVSPALSLKAIRNILWSFIIGCLLTCIACLVVATYHLTVLNDPSLFMYHELSSLVKMHPAYLSMYLCFAVAIILDKSVSGSITSLIRFIILSILVVTIILLSARLQVVILFMGAIGFSLHKLWKKFGLLKATLGTIVLSICILFAVFLFPQNRERFLEAISYDSTRWGESQIRGSIWPCAIEVIKSNFLTGVGTGDSQDVLEMCYVKNDYTALTYWKDVRFNAHNQFLETTIDLGIVGLILLMIGPVRATLDALSDKKNLYLVFISIFLLSCLTESMLERQRGVIFFAFFNSFLRT